MAEKASYEESEQRLKDFENGTLAPKRSEEALHRSAGRFRRLFEQASDAFFVHDFNNGRIVDANESACKHLGYTRDELLELNVSDIEVSYTPEAIVEICGRVETDGPVIVEGIHRRKGGSTFPVEISLGMLQDENPPLLLTIARDTTERKQAEEALRESEERQRTLIEAVSRAGISLFVVDNEYKVRYMNEPMIAGFGDATGSICYLEVGGLDSPCEYCKISKVIRNGETTYYQPTVADGRTFDIIAVPYTDTDHTRCKLEIIHDITERKQIEENLRESEEKFRSLVGNIPGVSYRCRYDEQWTVEFISDEVKMLTGYPASDFLQNAVRSWASILHPEDKEASEEYAMERINRKEPYTLEYRIISADGNIRWCYEKGQGVFDEQGNLRFLDGVIVDHTDLKQAEEALRESEEKLNTLLNATASVAVLAEADGTFTACNDALAKSLGKKKEELIGKPMMEFFSAEVAEKTKVLLQSVVTSKKPLQWEDEHAGRYFDNSAYPILDDNGNVKQIALFAKDTSERKQAENKLKESEERFRMFFEQAGDAVFIHNLEEQYVEVNERACRSLGYSKDELMAISAADIEVGWEPKNLHELWEDLKANIVITTTGEQRRKDGSTFPVEVRLRSIQRDDQKLMMVMARDISFRKQAEEALLKEKDFTENLINTAQVIILVLDTEGRIVRFNPFMRNISGYKLDEVRGMDWFTTFLPEQDYDQTRALFKRAVTNISTHGNINPIVAKDGREIIVEWYDKTLKDAAGNATGLLSIGQDITSRMQAEEALRKSEERFRTVANFTHDWEYWVTPDGHYVYVSPSCQRITDYTPDEFINDPGLLEKIVHPDDHSNIVDHFQGEADLEKLPSVDFRIITRSGEERWISHVCQAVYGTNGAYLGRRGSNRDISKQKLLQEELLKAKKLESVGVLAGGIAHDFNNLMSVIVGNISLARTEMRPGSKGFKNLVEAEKASIQTTALTSRLITFSKGGGPVKEPVSIGDLVKNSVDSSLKGSNIICRFSIPDDISLVEADEEQMKQVIHNITTNAQEAMAEQGTINVSCGNVIVGEKDALTLKDGKYVKISIEDQGPGIPEEDLISIFDPYFSTKDMGTQKGMGLGLAVSDSIVKKHDGVITVESKLGTGTTFSIYLPASEKEIVGATPVKNPVPEISESKGEKILVMDDEEVVRDVSYALLTHLGYEVEVAVDGVEAIELYKKAMESEKPFDMVILDLTNKVGMGGAETMVNLLEIDPDVKAIVASGYSNDPLMSNFWKHGFRGALPKPFNLDKLKEALHDAITGE